MAVENREHQDAAASFELLTVTRITRPSASITESGIHSGTKALSQAESSSGRIPAGIGIISQRWTPKTSYPTSPLRPRGHSSTALTRRCSSSCETARSSSVCFDRMTSSVGSRRIVSHIRLHPKLTPVPCSPPCTPAISQPRTARHSRTSLCRQSIRRYRTRRLPRAR